MAEVSVESVRITVKSTALVNSAKRTVCLKVWSGNLESKNKLCGVPFDCKLFVPEINKALERSADKAKGFPEKKVFRVGIFFAWDPKSKRGPRRSN